MFRGDKAGKKTKKVSRTDKPRVSLCCMRTLAKLCCTRYQSNHFPVQRLKSYRVQEDTGNCNIRAIIFLTVKGRVFCANPKQQWVIEAKKCSSRLKDNVEQNFI
uniref:Chemokine interleukin-8-like domain-containing protein n=1 Tax=Oryzias sinensis TaxID=183150 RepID=A0A8C7WQN8_9TELE